eukprot:COSAG02_NODE_3161_length_7251_cov_51.907159_2_plen_84_part_00
MRMAFPDNTVREENERSCSELTRNCLRLDGRRHGAFARGVYVSKEEMMMTPAPGRFQSCTIMDTLSEAEVQEHRSMKEGMGCH